MKRILEFFIRARGEFRCGRHSGFSLCCILWFILGWKFVLKWFSPKRQTIIINGEPHEIWPQDYQNFYHHWMDARQPLKDMPDLCPDVKRDAQSPIVVDKYKIVRVTDWGMIPCPYHLWRRKRNTVLTCFHSDFMKWTPEAEAMARKEYPELCVKK